MLKLDFDKKRKPSVNELASRLNRAGYELVSYAARRSPSGRGWHVRIITNPAPGSNMEIVALQAVLGSDPYREACNVQRVRNLGNADPFWADRWNVLYGSAD